MQRSNAISCVVALTFWATSTIAAPQRVVSMNLCTDQLLMLIADADQIQSLSKIADDPFSSVMAETAKNFALNSGQAEEIFAQNPDLVLAGIYTEKASIQMLQDLGVRVELFNPAATFDDIRTNIERIGALLGQGDRAAMIIDRFDARLDVLQSGITTKPRAALYYANGYTTGTSTMAGHILNAAGFENIADEAGISWGGTLPLETLVALDPDFVVTGTVYPGFSRSEEILQHPALRPLKTVASTDAKWVCGTPAVLDAIEELQRVHPDKRKQ